MRGAWYTPHQCTCLWAAVYTDLVAGGLLSNGGDRAVQKESPDVLACIRGWKPSNSLPWPVTAQHPRGRVSTVRGCAECYQVSAPEGVHWLWSYGACFRVLKKPDSSWVKSKPWESAGRDLLWFVTEERTWYLAKLLLMLKHLSMFKCHRD